MISRRPAAIGCLTLILLLILAAAWRLHYGIDVTDESYYVALAFRFVLGDRPFVDEFSLHQGAALLTYPALKAYFWVVGSLDGVMIFTRYLHLSLSIALAALAFLVLRKHLDPLVALLAAAPCIAFVPFNIHNLSYYTLGSSLQTAGLLLGFLSTLEARKATLLFLSGLFSSLSVVAFPTLVVPLVGAAVVLWFAHAERRQALAAAFCAGCAVVLGAVLCLLIPAGTEQLKGNLENFLSYYGTSKHPALETVSSAAGLAEWFAYHPLWGKLARVVLRYLEWFPNEGVVSKVVFLAVLAGLRWKTAWGRYGLLATPLLMIPEYSYLGGGNFVRNYALLAPFLFYFQRQDPLARRLFLVVWLPAFVAGLSVSWGSGNGAYAAAVGFFPGCLITTVYLVMLIKAWLPPSQFNAVQALPALWATLALVLCMGAVVHDDPIGSLSKRISAGPYRSIFTTPANHAYLEQLRGDLAAVSQPGKRILCLYMSSAGYLLSGLRPATNGILLHSPADIPTSRPQVTLDYYARTGRRPDVVLLTRRIPLGKTHSTEPFEVNYTTSDPLYRMVTGPDYQVTAEHPNYTVLTRR